MSEENNFIDTIPEEHRDKPWAKENSESPETFFKYVDNMTTLVGAKGIIVPEEGASKDKVEAYQIALGRPETKEGYEFKNIEAVGNAERNVEMDDAVRDIFFNLGVPKATSEKVVAQYETLLHGKVAEQQKVEEEQDKAFSEFNTKLFGDKKATVVANAQKLLRETLPKEALPMFDKMDADTLAVVIAATHGVYKKYGKEDDFTGGGGEGAKTGETFEELSAQQRKLMQNEAFSKWDHPDHEKIQTENKALMDKMRAVDAAK